MHKVIGSLIWEIYPNCLFFKESFSFPLHFFTLLCLLYTAQFDTALEYNKELEAQLASNVVEFLNPSQVLDLFERVSVLVICLNIII